MTRSVLTFTLKPGMRDAFVQAFRDLEVLAISSFQSGYRGGQLHVDADDPNRALVIASWDSPEAYQGWLDNPEREGIGEQLDRFLAADPEGCVMNVVQDVGPQTPVTGR